ncbi:2-isopropylmalate synthase [Endozoicomonas sp. OPT23]|uniref:2-isopropylmalate synthase n=1 Tax=Endozoicomonas sp. OPT23 TaxID=2072845 RepID=UPI00129BF3A7|nr:2-isopropylmalate synthase [Endozoicomonas sp. OPT23]
MNNDQVIIFDTTLRDGEQSPGAAMTKDEKVRIARSLEMLKVDVIEAGFAIASPGDFDAVNTIAKTIKDSAVCSLSRALPADIDRAAEALKPAARGRIHTFIATSPIHMQHKLCMTPDQVVEQAVTAVKRARNLIDDVEFSCEDAGRSEIDFLCRIIEAAIDAGARTINIPDTVGYALPHQYGDTIRQLIERIPNADKAIFSVHCHNDLGLAVANSLSAVVHGARQVECTINGLGERAGNASLEEIVMAIQTRKDELKVSTGVNTQHIVPTSRLVSSITGFPVQPNKAIVGANAFAHESGIHQDGILKNRETYEIMRAEDVGWNTNRLTLGKLSGRNAFKSKMEELGISFDSKEELNEAFGRFKVLADKKSEIFDDDLQALVSDVRSNSEEEKYRLIDLQACSTTQSTPEATLTIEVDGEPMEARSQGDGPVDAIFKAIESIANSQAHLALYNVSAITSGTDSQGDASVRLEKDGRIVNGSGTDTDVVIASAKAYINALNLLHSQRTKTNPQTGHV